MIRTSRTLARLAAGSAAAMLCVLSATTAVATPVVDQSHTTTLPNTSLTALINEGCKYVSQSFTAGVTGKLVGVNISVQSTAGAPPLRVAFRRAINNTPSYAPLGVRYLSNPQAPLSRLITFPQEIDVVAGQKYAIVVSYEDDVGHGWGDWNGSTGNLYAGGRYLSGECPSYGISTFWYRWDVSYDLHFRTYVDPDA